jgi:hypothetical protein
MIIEADLNKNKDGKELIKYIMCFFRVATNYFKYNYKINRSIRAYYET